MCGGSSNTPTMAYADKANDQTYGLNNIAGGQDLLKSLQARMGQGLDPNAKSTWEAQGTNNINAMLKGGIQQTSNMGNTSLAGKAGVMDKLYTSTAGNLGNLQGDIAKADESAHQQNYWNGANAIPGLSTSAFNIGAGKQGQEMQRVNQYNQGQQQQYQMDKAGEFDWGGLISMLLSGGSKVLAGGL